MNNDNQIKHHIWWIIKTLGDINTKDTTIESYKKFLENPLSETVCNDIDELVAYIKTNY